MTDENRIEELEIQVQRLQRRLAGHQEAIVRWRRRAGVEAPAPEMVLYKSEIYTYRDERMFRGYYTLPVEPAPDLTAEAWAWLLEHNLTVSCDRVSYDERKGWIVTLVKEWKS